MDWRFVGCCHLGAKHVAWRVGGTGAGAADDGCDLKAQFYVPASDGQIVAHQWWVERKGRTTEQVNRGIVGLPYTILDKFVISGQV